MADAKKSFDWSEAASNSGYIIIVIALAFFCWLKLSDKYLYIFGNIVSCYTFAFITAFIILLRIVIKLIKKNNGNFDFMSGLLTAALFITFVCSINSAAGDAKNSKVKDVLKISEETQENSGVSVVLCEVTEFNNTINADSTFINVYRVSGGIAKKIGVIDEMYFSVECIKEDMYTYFINADKSTITIECSYGFFGDGIIMMNPAYETGKIRYVFKLE